MPAQTRSSTTTTQPPSRREERRPQPRPGDQGNAARQEDLQQPAAPTRNAAYAAYAERLVSRVAAIQAEPDRKKQAEQARAMLAQAVSVSDSLAIGETVDVAALPLAPATGGDVFPMRAFPPEWLRSARVLLDIAGGSGAPGASTGPLSGQTRDGIPGSANTLFEGLRSFGRQRQDYGVPAYQTQSNNLAAPEATCNGTSLAMVLERLGYSRSDLLQTIANILKKKEVADELRAQKVPEADIARRVAETDLSCVMLKDSTFAARVKSYLEDENERGSNYQRPRGGTASSAEIDQWSKAFKDEAGIDDVALLLMDILGIERTAVNSGNNPKKLVETVAAATGRQAPTTERIESARGWERTRPIVVEALEQGGAAMLSMRHKGRGKSGTHIVAIQAATENGMVVDDPYGQQREDYSAAKAGDAYANPGRTRSNSGLRNAVDSSRDDWKQSAEVSEDEVRGESNTWSDDKIRDSWAYVVIFRRATTPVADPAAPTTGPAATPTGPARPAS